MLFYFREISFIKLLIPFAAGIVLPVFLPIKIPTLLLLIVLLFLFLLFIILHFNFTLQKKYGLRWINGVLVTLLLFIGGYLFCVSRIETGSPQHYSHWINSGSKLIAQVTEPITEKEKSYKSVAEIIYVVNNDKPIKTIGNILIYFKKDDAARKLKYGDIILLPNRLTELPPPGNPHEFNYKQFMSFRQIYHQCYLTTDSWKVVGNDADPVMAWVLNLRHRLYNILEDNIEDENSLAVASSLLLGLREKLDDDLIQAYSSSGAMHVLAVSGLHVGIIYFILNSLLFFLKFSRKTKIIRAILLVLCIWLYAALTGLSPSVMRAAVMFTALASADCLRRSTNTFNVLACSAFALLFYNPFLIMEVGFQLSYAAVIGILILQPFIYNLFYSRNWIIDKLWMITAVSIAAQVATFPIGLLYFHQFPVYFFVSNLVVIPAATIILYLGISLFVFFKVAILSTIIAWLLNGAILLLNKVIFIIESLPYSLIKGISISIFDSWLIYSAISGIIAFLIFKQWRFLLVSLSLIVALFILSDIRIFKQLHQQEMIVYKVSDHKAIDFIQGKKNLFLSDSSLINDNDKMLFHIEHNWWESGVKKPQANDFTAYLSQQSRHDGFPASYKNYFFFRNKKMVIIDQPQRSFVPLMQKLSLDYILISGDPDLKIQDLTGIYNFEEIIFDASNSNRKIAAWKEECTALGIKYHNVAEEGAFIAKL